MIGKPVVRVVALLATLGQLQQLPAAVACAGHHARPVAASHCGGGLPAANGPAVTAQHDAGTASCAGLPCLAQAPAALQLTSSVQAPIAPPAVAPALAQVPVSFSVSPPSPPPQA